MQFQYSAMFLVRFWNRVDRTGDCWLWTGPKTGNGYGAIREDYPSRKQVSAHRASWVIHFGPIAPGLEVCHHCDNPICVRPEHLFLGTTKANAVDRSRKGRSGAGDRSGRRLHPERYPNGSDVIGAKLTDDVVRVMRQRYASGQANMPALAAEHGVSVNTVSRIINRLAWSHVE